MSHYRPRTFAVAVVAAAALFAAEPGSASVPTAFSGTFANTASAVTSFRQADGNTFISETVSVVYAGDLAGPVVEQIDVVIHPDGSFDFKGTDYCACTLAGSGRSGTIALPFTGTGEPDGSLSGRFTIGDGTGGLANMRGIGTFESSNGAGGSFAGTYHFDP
jgi:hypothetical protein